MVGRKPRGWSDWAPLKVLKEMADVFTHTEGNTAETGMGQVWEAFPGSESMACPQRNTMNVGDPTHSSPEVWADKYKSERAQKVCRKSDGP